MIKVNLHELMEKMELKKLTPPELCKGKEIVIPDINRPALQLAGFFNHFESDRVQVIGYVEYTYLESLSSTEKEERYNTLFSYNIPCFIFCRDLQPDSLFLEKACQAGITIFTTDKKTSSFTAELIRWLHKSLAPTISIHGGLVDIYGVGVLIKGESGIGKSEAALELIKRGHRLVTDDVVEIHKISESTLIGTSPEITRYLIELRGIGIIDVKSLYGVQSVKETQQIDMVVNLEEWSRETDYERLGKEEYFEEFLGNKVCSHNIPVRPGRNLAIILESAAVNHRQKLMGYNAADELYRRVQENLEKNL